ncbi:putative Holliday junction resolvase [Orenia metallireducens]|jgi:putative Holliday junction resolvase|uniref:Putative pre-16S rRNA nuclease n=1 Tax=Orenia metallireducens TaxID=1413210 RepID=A0A285IBA5_9FIRM|nr:Holliday junction resolvase RuvX [Orenia metallireducens]PRX21680.1 putative Holliday junction resolvase [Orenia metallireducens]SNY44336.1 putative holliday junction resolvase [Orenia metallireducens]
MKIMGLDVGDVRTGVAVSDALGWTAQGKEVIKSKSLEEDIEYIASLVEEYNVEKIVVGLPKNMNGSLGPRAEKVLNFVENLKNRLDLPIITWDERLSTVAAERTLIQADLSRKKRKEVIDKMAAVVILQNYLDSIN